MANQRPRSNRRTGTRSGRRPPRRNGHAPRAVLRRVGAAAFGALLGFSSVYVLLLNRQVTEQFDGQRWQLPARVYAAPRRIFHGQALDKPELVQELEALGYRRRPVANGPGSYSTAHGRVDIVTRGFDFPDGSAGSVAVRVVFNGGRVASLTTLPGGRQAAPLRLEPRDIGSIHPAQGEDRVLVDMANLPPALVPTLLAVEDRHFFHHRGINPIAILRAVWANLRAGRAVQGGSTLTQQLVKNFFLSHDRTLARKAKEAILATILEWRYDKEEILEAYLNEIFLGQDGARAIHGFGLAAQFYFARPLEELELPQIALLVGLARGASYYNPRRHPERAMKRRNRVLGQLRDTQTASDSAVAAAIKAPLGVTESPHAGSSGYPAFLELVRRQLRRDYREQDLQNQGLKVYTTLAPQVQGRAEAALRRRLAELEIRRKLPRGKLQGAVLVSSRHSGEIEAVVGGRDAHFDGFNRALDARRPVGSLVKPAVYLSALERPQRWSLTTLIDDSPIRLRDARGQPWRPKNYDRKSHGMVPLQQALAKSYNVSTVRLALQVGLPKVRKTLHALGVEDDLPAYPSLALGSASLSPLTMTQVYQTLAAGGFRAPLRSIAAVTTQDGKTLRRYRVQAVPAADPRAVYLTNQALREVVRNGTARGLRKMLPSGLEVAGKTGTTNKLRDSWFAGFTARRVAVVWVGHDDNTPAGLTGSQGAMTVWGELMAGEHPQALGLVAPDGVVTVRVAGANGSCAQSRTVPYYASHPPAAGSRCDQGPPTVDAVPSRATGDRHSPPGWLFDEDL